MVCRTSFGDPHDHDQVGSFPDPMCESVIGDSPGAHGLVPFNLNIAVFIEAPTSHRLRSTTYSCRRGASESDKRGFFNQFQAAIHRYWNNKLWLRPAVRRETNAPNLLCGVSLRYVTDPAQANLRIRILWESNPPYRPHCERGGHDDRTRVDMVIEYPNSNRPSGASNNFDWEQEFNTSNHSTVVFHQNTAAHEFGHYIGHNHTCHGQPGVAPNSEAEYCANASRGRQRSIMSTGNSVRREHADPWLTRLQHHHVRCGLTWTAYTVRERPPPG